MHYSSQEYFNIKCNRDVATSNEEQDNDFEPQPSAIPDILMQVMKFSPAIIS
jgi:hypothetical protein